MYKLIKYNVLISYDIYLFIFSIQRAWRHDSEVMVSQIPDKSSTHVQYSWHFSLTVICFMFCYGVKLLCLV